MESPANYEIAQELGLLPEEFDEIKKHLGRIPNLVELNIYAVMWSEHCCYKNSIAWLKKLPKDSPRLLAKAGEENAGLVDIGDNLACSFKIESHNHPSAIEPFQGAATGVGGINRDIFTMGARPIAQLNSLRFGNPHSERTKRIMKGVVKGISHYGNAFGVPTVGGEVFFDERYEQNPLVNAFSAGIVKIGKTVSAISYGVGNPVMIIGAATGKDGIHGATFASDDLSEDAEKDLPAVQVGDPFLEKLLLEATLEIIESGCVIGMQDMGAAGIICSTSEMSAKGKHGMIIHLDQVPMRQPNMKAWEILLSESQERMLVVVKKGKEHIVKQICEKWDLLCAQIGEVTDTKRLQFYYHGELVADVPAESLVLGGGAPVYYREYKEPAYYQEFKKFDINQVAEPSEEECIKIAEYLISHPNIASKAWVYEQYDSMVGTANANSVEPCDASVVHVKGTNKFLVISLDCNARYVNADPEVGTQIAVAEAARNVTVSGGEPLAITNNLNFGNPYNPEVYWQFVGAIMGMKKACEKFQTPVTGGNVSFYNQSADGTSVLPTPTIGMLGLMTGIENRISIPFKHRKDLIYLLGKPHNDIASSEYLYSYIGIKASPAPAFDLEYEYQLQQEFRRLASMRLFVSAHDVSDGGLWIALVESAIHYKFGFHIETPRHIRKDAFLFGESQSRIVVSILPENQELFEKECKVDFILLGEVTDSTGFVVDGIEYCYASKAKQLYEKALPKILEN
ncbi:MAG: phosphoribosylformylglycinamidine synthase subunit PurL [Cytophagales bacterium]|nr:phosphoribosylformylglycinamidine synthase subunit PurL [Cytophagales bacterium]MDW8384847.1 phosphoribosylformylglycinamidine synthase subunit PurL [Flammeovirgaceae bacterium]